MSAYWGVHFFEFFQVLITRLFTGDIFSPSTDEIQLGTLLCIAVSCGLIGPFLVLKRMAMFANSLSHTLLLGVVGAFLMLSGGALFDFSHMLLGALIASILTAICTEVLIKWFHLTEDASIGLVFTCFFALGITLVTLFTRDVHLGLESVMGNADALRLPDLWLSCKLMGINAVVIFLLYYKLQIVSFDVLFAKALGVRANLLHFVLLFLVAITCIGAFRAVGVLLVLALLIGPYLTARLFCHQLSWLIFHSCWIGALASVCAVAFARHILSAFDLPISTGGTLVCMVGVIYFVTLFIVKQVEARKKNALATSPIHSGKID